MGFDDRSEGSRLLEQRINAGQTERQRDRNFKQKLLMAGLTGASRIGGGLLKAALDKKPEAQPLKDPHLHDYWDNVEASDRRAKGMDIPAWLKSGKMSDEFPDPFEPNMSRPEAPAKGPDMSLTSHAWSDSSSDAAQKAIARDQKNAAAQDVPFAGIHARSGLERLNEAADTNTKDLHTGQEIINYAGGMMRSKPYMPWGAE